MFSDHRFFHSLVSGSFVLVGLYLILLAGGWALATFGPFNGRDATAEGTIIEIVDGLQVVRFHMEDRNEIVFTAGSTGRISPYDLKTSVYAAGEAVPVAYDPDNPADARVIDSREWRRVLNGATGGFAGLVIGWLLWRFQWRGLLVITGILFLFLAIVWLTDPDLYALGNSGRQILVAPVRVSRHRQAITRRLSVRKTIYRPGLRVTGYLSRVTSQMRAISGRL